MFKAGDKIKCINAENSFGLSQNAIYTVSGFNEFGSVFITEISGSCWSTARF